jgi:hypothetical protein
MVSVNIKSLADGVLISGVGDLYTAPVDTQTIVKTVTYVNNYTSSQNVSIFLLVSGSTARKIIPVTNLGVGYLLVMDDAVTLEAGDKIQGQAAISGVVDYVVSGVEEG